MVKRFFQVVVVFFAIYSFVFVPLGKKTALEHLRAIFGTPAAREAAEEVKGGVTRLVRRLESEARQSTEKTDRRLRERDAEQSETAEQRETADPSDAARAREPGEPREEKTPRGEKVPKGEPGAHDGARAEEAATPRPTPKLRALSAEAPAPVQH